MATYISSDVSIHLNLYLYTCTHISNLHTWLDVPERVVNMGL